MDKVLNAINFHRFTHLMSDDEMDEWHNYYNMSDKPGLTHGSQNKPG